MSGPQGHGAFTLYDLDAIASIARAASGNKKISFVSEHASAGVSVGTARHLCVDELGNFLGAREDVRDAFLRVTMRSGFERFVPMAEMVELVRSGRAVLDYDAEERQR